MSGTLWPSGHFSASAVRPGRKKQNYADHPLAGIHHDGILKVFPNRETGSLLDDLCFQLDYFESMERWDDMYQVLDKIASIPDVPEFLEEYWASRGERSPMGLSVVHNPRKVPIRRNDRDNRYGEKGISSYGKKMIASSCTVLEGMVKNGLIAFLTVTTPALTDDQLELLNSQWSTVVRRFHDEIRRELVRGGLPDDLISVSEIQERRFNRWGQVCLHLHILFQGRLPGEDWALSKEFCRDLWQRILSNHGIDADCRSATRIEKLRKSAAKEMAKYLSKGGKCLGAVKAAGKSHQLPCQWWYVSPCLKLEVKRRLKKVSGSPIERIIRHREILKELGLAKYHEVWMELKDPAAGLGGDNTKVGTGREILMGIAGFFVNGVDGSLFFDAQSDAEFFEAVNVNLERLSNPQGVLVSVCS